MSGTHKLTCDVCAATITVVPFAVEAGGVALASMRCPACRQGGLVGAPGGKPDGYRMIGYERLQPKANRF